MRTSQPSLIQIAPLRNPLPRGKSHLEEDLVMQIRFEDLPAPQREHRFHPTRLWRFDFSWPDRRIAIELEGGIFVTGRHNRPVSMEGDMEKYNAAVLLGWRLGRFSKRMVAEGHAVRWLIEMFKQTTKEE